MNISVKKPKAAGPVEIPGLKSDTIRAAFIADPASGTFTIKIPLFADGSYEKIKS